MVAVRYTPSRKISLSHQEDGALVVHCARTGAIGVVPPEDAEMARRALVANQVTIGPLTGILEDLERGGFLVPEAYDEEQEEHLRFISRYTDPSLHLILMPTEECNFRCVYCYESFKRGQMTPEVQQGVRNFVTSQSNLTHLAVSWFGGEPLLAGDVVLEMTEFFSSLAAARDVKFYCMATTNGYLLTPQYAERVIAAGLNQFQITLDGLEHEHDARRRGANGEKTFETIWENLQYLHSTDLDFLMIVRHNFDPGNYQSIDNFLDLLGREFGEDPRFTTEMAPIGKWGGPNDSNLEVCEGRSAVESVLHAKRRAAEVGFHDSQIIRMMQPEGSACYAANPRSFVIGPDGNVYKCTVELDYHDRNIVGQVHPSGEMTLDWHKMALWCETNGTVTETKCTKCYFSPACHGAVCPKEWMDEGDVACPPHKHAIKENLTLIRAESLLSRPPIDSVAACTRG
jgi:uncharacterized protein